MVQKLALKIKESLPKHMIDNKLTKEFFPLAYKNVYKGNKWKKKKTIFAWNYIHHHWKKFEKILKKKENFITTWLKLNGTH